MAYPTPFSGNLKPMTQQEFEARFKKKKRNPADEYITDLNNRLKKRQSALQGMYQ